VALIFLNIIVDQIWLKATIFGLLMPQVLNPLEECGLNAGHRNVDGLADLLQL